MAVFFCPGRRIVKSTSSSYLTSLIPVKSDLNSEIGSIRMEQQCYQTSAFVSSVRYIHTMASAVAHSDWITRHRSLMVSFVWRTRVYTSVGSLFTNVNLSQTHFHEITSFCMAQFTWTDVNYEIFVPLLLPLATFKSSWSLLQGRSPGSTRSSTWASSHVTMSNSQGFHDWFGEYWSCKNNLTPCTL